MAFGGTCEAEAVATAHYEISSRFADIESCLDHCDGRLADAMSGRPDTHFLCPAAILSTTLSITSRLSSAIMAGGPWSSCAQRPLFLRRMNQHPLDARSASLTASGRL
jgi:hypothetical protein